MRLVRPLLAADGGALVAGNVEPREPADAVGNRGGVGGREPERRQVEVVVLRVRIGPAHEPVVAVAEVEDRRPVQRVDVIDRDLARDELEPLAGREVVEVVVVVAVAIVPAHAPVHPLLVGEHVVDADRVVGVLDLLGERRVLEVARAVTVPGGRRQRDVVHDRARDGVDQVLRNDVAGKRILLEPPVGRRPPGERVVNLVLRPDREELGEIAAAHALGRHRRRAVVARPRFLDALEPVHEERPPVVLAHGTAGDAAVAVIGEVRERDAVHVREEIVGEERRRRLGVVRGAPERVRAGLDRQVRHAALGIAEARVERRRLDLELLHEIRRRHVGRDDFAGVRGRGAGHAVDGQVAAVAARPVHRVADDVRGLEGTIEASRAGVGDAGRKADERVRIAVGRRQLRDAPRVDDGAERRVGRLDQGNLGGDVDRLERLSELEHEIDGERIGDSDFDLPRGFLEARELRRYLIGAGQQIRCLEEAKRVRRQRDGRAHRDVRDRHGGAGDDAAAAVADRSGDGSARVLRRGAGRERRDHESRHEDGRRSCEPVAAASLSRAPHHRLLLLVPSTRGASS